MRRTIFLALALSFTAIACGSSLPGEADLPPEATMAFPGSVELQRSFHKGQTGTYIDGSSADVSPRLEVEYSAPPDADSETVMEWFTGELQRNGWTLRDMTGILGAVSAEKLDDNGDGHSLGVHCPLGDCSTYTVTIVFAGLFDDE